MAMAAPRKLKVSRHPGTVRSPGSTWAASRLPHWNWVPWLPRMSAIIRSTLHTSARSRTSRGRSSHRVRRM